MPNASENIIRDPKRLETLNRLELLDSAPEKAFDRLTQLASKILKAPVSLVSLVDADRQFFKSFFGLPDPWASQRETPLSHSFCQHVVATGEPLVVSNAVEHPLVHDNLAIPDINVIAYLGIPLTTTDGTELGSFCVIDSTPRQWTPEEIEIVRELALSVMTEIELRSEIAARREIEEKLRETNKEVEQANRQLKRVTEFALSTIEYSIEAMQRGAPEDEVLTYLSSAKSTLANGKISVT